MELLRDSRGELLRARTFSATAVHTPRPDDRSRTLCGGRVILLSEYALTGDDEEQGYGKAGELRQADMTVCAGDDPQLCKRCEASVAKIQREATIPMTTAQGGTMTNAAREELEAFVDKTILKQRSEAMSFAAGVRDRNTRDKAVAAILAAADVYAQAVADAARAEAGASATVKPTREPWLPVAAPSGGCVWGDCGNAADRWRRDGRHRYVGVCQQHEHGKPWFAAERMAKVLAMPPVLGGRRGEVIHYAQVLCRDGGAYTAPADDVHMVDLLSGNKVLLLREWDDDWTGERARMVNEVRHVGREQA
jgi:hypothetical protein